MRNRLFTFVMMVALVVGVSVACVAMPSLGGPTGVVTVPTADAAPVGEFQLALSYQSVDATSLWGDMLGLPVPEDLEDISLRSLQVLTGVSEEAELWAAFSDVSNRDEASGWAIGGKYLLVKNAEESASLAVGGSWEDWSVELAERMWQTGSIYDPPLVTITMPAQDVDLKVTRAYLVATKDFTPMGAEDWEWGGGAGTRMLGSLGVMYVNIDPDGGDDASLTEPFVALQFVDAGGTSLGLEYRWDDDELDVDAVFSAVLSYPFSPEWTVEVGTTNASPGGLGLEDQDFFVRVGYCVPMG